MQVQTNNGAVTQSGPTMSTKSLPQLERADASVEQNRPAPLYKKLASRLGALQRGQKGRKRIFDALPQPSQARLDASLSDVAIDADELVNTRASAPSEKEKTVLYLAYGSNLCNETFRGVRGIRPLSQVNVLVPSLRLTFDLPGIPYKEPCFANSARREPDVLDYHKDRWHKGLVGVVYEVTLSDYAHIIATEGGGSAYNDILIDCYVLPASDTVPSAPNTPPFKAHTLFAPARDTDGVVQSTERVTRPDPGYAQPSPRYMKLITDGAAECDLPAEYQDYLHGIRTYTITTKKQAMGQALFLSIWMPFVLLIFSLSRKMQDNKGRAPKWVGFFSAIVFKGMWVSYDGVFKGVFGDGERTVGDEAAGTWVATQCDAERAGLLEEVVDVMQAHPDEDEKRDRVL
jgi:hypothetical protein